LIPPVKILLTILLGTMALVNGQWLTDWKVATDTAASTEKLILLNFSGSDWCGPCIRMHKEIFEDPAFASYAEKNLVLVSADFPRLKKNRLSEEQTKQNEKLADKYNPEGRFPFTVLLDSKGKVLKSWEGLPRATGQSFTDEIIKVNHGGR
jgi:thioredoxin-related protein